MDKTIRKYSNFDEMKADEYRYWQSRPVHERLAAVAELTEEPFKLKGFKPDAFDYRELLSAFNAHRVRYLVVGAYARSVTFAELTSGRLHRRAGIEAV